MEFTRVNFKPSFFGDRPLELLCDGALKATAFRYETSVCGLKIQNQHCSMVVLPYMGQQIWFWECNGKNLTQKSIFDQPQATTKFGDNYGGFLLHCGLTNINCAGEGEDYPLHGELPFANYPETYVGIGRDESGKYLAVGGTYIYRNSQEYHYAYSPELRLYDDSSVLQMHIDLHNRRGCNLDYMFMCHMNWLAVDGSRVVYSAKKDTDHIKVDPTELGGDSPRAVRIREFYHSGRDSGKMLTDEEYYRELESLAGDLSVEFVVVDPSAASFIATIRAHRRFSVRKARNEVLSGIRLVGSLLREGYLQFAPCCKDAIREFSLYRWEEDGQIDRVQKENDHAMDDIRYFCATVLGRKRRNNGGKSNEELSGE